MKKMMLNIKSRLAFTVWVGILILLWPISLCAENLSNHEIDSLKQSLSSQLSDAEAIRVLSRLSKLNEQKPEQVTYLTQKLEIAKRIDSISAVYATISDLASYYNNLKSGADSLAYWTQVLDSLARSRNEYPDALFEVKGLSCQRLFWSGNYEQALNDAVELYRIASETQQNYGLVRCSESLGQIYQSIRRDSDAVVAYQEGLDRLKLVGVDKELELCLTSYQTESYLRTNMHEKTGQNLEIYKRLIDEQVKRNEKNGELYPVDREYWLLYSFYTNYYLQKNDLKKAKEAIDMATRYEGSEFVEGDYAIGIYLAIKARYNAKAGNIPLALYYIDKILETERLPEDLKFKADILKKQGEIDEALKLYDEIYEYGTQRNDDMFLRQMNQLRTLQELSHKETQEREKKASQERMAQQQRQLLFYSLFIILLILVLYILYIYIRRVQRLKDAMLCEKDALLKSEKKLILETMRADEASRMKSTFIANMSHEIRSPLNAIVGFSGLLIDDGTAPEERTEYSAIIQNNTDLMLTLVNDVLDLSKMETGDLSFNLKHYHLFDCCQKALNSIRQRVPVEVKLTFTPAPEPIIVYTDTMRLQQLLINLLTNSAKFTDEGEINLSYSLEADRKHVCISVTDTGRGVPTEKQADIFKRFEKLDDYKPGVGLGLSICSIIAEHLSGPGTIYLDSTYTTGARFVFIHPCETDGEAGSPETGEIK